MKSLRAKYTHTNLYTILGHSAPQKAPVFGGSQSVASIGPAIQAAAMEAKLKVAQLVINDPKSPLHGAAIADVASRDGRLLLNTAPGKSDSYVDILVPAVDRRLKPQSQRSRAKIIRR